MSARALWLQFIRALHIGRADAQVPPPPPPPARPEYPLHTILAGNINASKLWCMERGADFNSPTITMAVSGPMLERALRGRNPDTTTVVFVYGHGADGHWAAAYNRTEMMRAMGATVIWHES